MNRSTWYRYGGVKDKVLFKAKERINHDEISIGIPRGGGGKSSYKTGFILIDKVLSPKIKRWVKLTHFVF